MKKGWKRFWIICGSVLGAGVFLCIISLVLGFTWEEVRAAYPDGIGWIESHHFDTVDWEEDWEEEWDSTWEEVWEDSGDVTSNSRDTQSGSFKKEFPWTSNLDLEMWGGNLTMKTYDGDRIRLEGHDINPKLQFKCYIDEDELCIRTSKGVWKDNGLNGKRAGTVTLYIPKGMPMEDIQLKVGAGKLTADELLGNNVEVDIGAGEAVLKEIQAYDLEMESGAGTITAECAVTGDIDVKCGVGSLDLTIKGMEESFNESINCGIGNIRIGDREYHGLGRTVKEERGGVWDLKVKCGVGTVNIDFE